MENEVKLNEFGLRPGLLPYEVVLVGKARENIEPIVKEEGDTDETIRAKILKNYSFTRTSELRDAAKTAGLSVTKFYHLQLSSPEGRTIMIRGEKKSASKESSRVATKVLFERERQAIFEDIHKNVATGKFKPTAGNLNNGKITLTDFILVGKWDIFSLGFKINPRIIDPKTGKKSILQAKRLQDDGSYKPENAVDSYGRHFIFEDDIDIIESLRETYRENVKRFKVPEPTDTRGPGAEAGTPETEPESLEANDLKGDAVKINDLEGDI